MIDPISFVSEPFWEPLSRHWPALIMIAILLIVIPILRRFVMTSIDDSEVRYRVRKIVTYGGMVLILFFLLIAISDQVARLSIALGAVGAAAVFALQEVVASIAGWVALSFGGFYKPGDRVQLGGIKGDVIDIGLLRTTLMETGAWVDGDLYSGRMVRVANSFVFKEPVYNYSSEFPFLWDEIKVPIDYSSDLEKAKALIHGAATKVVGTYTEESRECWEALTTHFLVEPARIKPTVMARANENWIECTVRYIVDYKMRRSTADAITREVLKALNEAGSEVKLGLAVSELAGQLKIELPENRRFP